MRFLYIWLLASMLTVVGCAKPESLTMRSATSPEGWVGSAFYRNNIIASEEFSTGKNGRAIDVWRFYDSYGRLYTEERDTTGNGRRNLHREYNKDGVLTVQKEDTTGDGAYDKVIDYTKKRGGRLETAPHHSRQPAAAVARQGRSNTSRDQRRKTVRTSKRKTLPAKQQDAASRDLVAAQPGQRSLTESETAPATNSMVVHDSSSAQSASIQATPAPSPRENFIRPVPMPAGGYADGANANSRIVPGPVFHHPSDGLEE